MAWPYTPLTTYTANTAPAIKAFDLNAFQAAINGIVAGTYNLQAATLTTGTPGAVVAPPLAGALSVSALGAQAGFPTSTIPQGVLPRGYVPIGWAQVTAGAALTWGENIKTITHPATGNYVVETNVAFAGITDGIAIVTSLNLASPRIGAAQFLAFGGQASASVLFWDVAAAPQDTAFQIIIYAE